jgi:two-component system, chemotaxis family, protein-glutamate methylesterase/glutaminase
MTPRGRVRVLIVDDSAIARDFLERGLSACEGIEVIGKASDAYSARDRIVLSDPDVVTLDVEMPGMDGIEFLGRLIAQYPIPVIIVSSVTAEGSRRAVEALEAGAIDVVPKPDAKNAQGLSLMIADLADKIRMASGANVRKTLPERARASEETARTAGPMRTDRSGSPVNRIIAIGASTGGTNALNAIIPEFPRDMPPVVVVQHMPPVFTRMFAESLDHSSRVTVTEAKSGDVLENGRVYIAPGDFHCTLVREATGYSLSCDGGEKVSGHRPSVDVLFRSVAIAAGSAAVGVLLTGMGRDGADGLLEMRRRGARCFAQDEESSVVFGMPKEAWANGAAERLIPSSLVTGTILGCLRADGRAVGVAGAAGVAGVAADARGSRWEP